MDKNRSEALVFRVNILSEEICSLVSRDDCHSEGSEAPDRAQTVCDVDVEGVSGEIVAVKHSIVFSYCTFHKHIGSFCRKNRKR
jgi:hypothetical protein